MVKTEQIYSRYENENDWIESNFPKITNPS